MSPIPKTGHHYASQLTQALVSRGVLDESWTDAFTQVPRHLFLPAFYTRTPGGWGLITPETVGQERWLQLAYHDVTWVQHLDGPGNTPGTPASSSIQPSLAARMLTALEPSPGDHVLEVGAGTGWLTALLSHRCGAGTVTGIELDPELIRYARTTLDELGYQPTLIHADGINGFAEHAPYHRVLSTAAVSHIPTPWLTQAQPRGRIVAPLRGAIAVIDVRDHTHALGRFLPEPVQILPLRSIHDPTQDTPLIETPRTIGSAPTTATLRDPRFRFVLGLSNPTLTVEDPGLLGDLLVTDAHGSSTRVSALGQVHTQGKRDLWAIISHVHQWWEHNGQPGPAHFLIEVDDIAQWATLAGSQPERRWRIR
ncbi:MAG: protein-L-isoaspartate O-methyltransferase family protein [Pseudonocardiaceae bacterium]